MAKYRKLPVVVEAEQFDGTARVPGMCNGERCGLKPEYWIEHVHTAHGPVNVERGTWVVRAPSGDTWPVADSIFRATYESAASEADYDWEIVDTPIDQIGPRWLIAVMLLAVVLVLIVAFAHAAETRHYFPVAPSAMAKNHHTHVQVAGRVTISQREADGDWHIRINDAQGFAVAECIPELPCAHPKVGQCVTVRGISRIDGEHKYPGTQVGWPEVHPVESLKVVNCHGL